MKQHWMHQLFIVGFAAIIILSHASMVDAQVDEARKTNWGNAKKLAQIIIETVKAGKQEKAYNATDEFRANLDQVEDKLKRAGQRLHPEDLKVLKPKTETVLRDLKDVRTSAGALGSTIKREGTKKAGSLLSEFNRRWEEFAKSFNQLWRDYNTQGKYLIDRMKKFREDCRQCN